MIKYYFIGNETSGPKLIRILEEKGGINVHDYLGDTNDAIYYCNPDNDEISFANETSCLGKIIKSNYEEIKLPFFHRGDRVLVKDFDSDVWREAIYSFTECCEKKNCYYVVGGNCFFQCIPFDINKLGKVTNE